MSFTKIGSRVLAREVVAKRMRDLYPSKMIMSKALADVEMILSLALQKLENLGVLEEFFEENYFDQELKKVYTLLKESFTWMEAKE
jgi:hypothetical protein